ncbi:MAG: glycosyltransferase [Candidatus Yanofskybacteria bacterium]|nr:glycosyltransferase [Candidatus Yanofskybacteria bacterium]
MKILFFSDTFPPDSYGGSDIVAHSLAGALVKMGHEVFILTTVRNKKDEGETVREGLKIYKVFSNYHERWRAYFGLYNPQVIGKVKEIIKKTVPDAVHAHDIHQHLSYHSLKLAKNSGAKVILTAHDAMPYSYGKVSDESKLSAFKDLWDYKLRYNPLRNLIIKHYLKNADKIVAVSDALKRALTNNSIKNVETIHNGMDLGNWVVPDESVADFKKKYGLENKKCILFGGRLSGAKGGRKMVEAMVKIARTVPEAILLVAGREDGYAKAMKEMARRENIAERIIFTGWFGRGDMKKAYFVSDVVAVPSLYLDPFPTVNLEAMAAKKPVVGTCFGGTSEIVVDGETGYIVNPNNVDLLADRITDLLRDGQKANQFGQSGYERVRDFFSLKLQVEKYLQYYKRTTCYMREPKFYTRNVLIKLFPKYFRGKLIDIGAGRAKYYELLNPHIDEYVAVDNLSSSYQYKSEQDKKKVTHISDASSLPFDSNEFDSALCTELIEHVEDPLSVVREAYRVLKPGGYFILTSVWLSPFHEEPKDYWRFSESGYRFLSRKTGFEFIDIKPLGGMFASLLYIVTRNIELRGKNWMKRGLETRLKRIAELIMEKLDNLIPTPDPVGHVVIFRKPK